MSSNSNRGVVYLNPGKVEVQKIDFPTFRNPAETTIDHGVILKVVTTNICGSDRHMVRDRTKAPAISRSHGRPLRGTAVNPRVDLTAVFPRTITALAKRRLLSRRVYRRQPGRGLPPTRSRARSRQRRPGPTNPDCGAHPVPWP